MTTVYVMITEDRHSEPDVAVYANPDAAIAAAKSDVRDNLRRDEDLDEEMNDAMRANGWLYYGQYSCEGDCIRVVQRELHDG